LRAHATRELELALHQRFELISRQRARHLEAVHEIGGGARDPERFRFEGNFRAMLLEWGASNSHIEDIERRRGPIRFRCVVVYDRAPTTFDTPLLRSKLREPEVRVEVALDRGVSRAHVAVGVDLPGADGAAQLLTHLKHPERTRCGSTRRAWRTPVTRRG